MVEQTKNRERRQKEIFECGNSMVQQKKAMSVTYTVSPKTRLLVRGLQRKKKEKRMTQWQKPNEAEREREKKLTPCFHASGFVVIAAGTSADVGKSFAALFATFGHGTEQ